MIKDYDMGDRVPTKKTGTLVLRDAKNQKES